MRGRLLAIGFVAGFVVAACLHNIPLAPAGGRTIVINLEAQTLPITKTLAWDPNPASDAVTNYTASLDAVTLGSPTTPSQPVTFTTLGSHTASLTATNLFGTSAATTLIINVNSPGSPKNAHLQ